MDVVSLSPLRVGSVLWRPRPDRWTLTVVCKATYALEPGESKLAADQEPVHEREGHWDGDARRSVHAPSDLAPFKPRADVVLVGHAYAPRSELARSLVVRVMVGEMEKAVEVHCPRALGREGDLREGARWNKMPIRYEYAAGGHSTWNPVGIGPGAQVDAYGQRPLPHLQPPELQVTQWSDIFVPTGLGPIAPAWRLRREKLGRHAEGWSDEAWTQIALDDDFDGEFFQVAPPDQQLDALRDDERLVLEYLHPEHPSLTTKLPGIHPHAFVEIPGSPPRDLVMTADTLWIDTDRFLCTLTWRGQVAVDGPEQQGRILVALEEAGQTLDWAEVSGGQRSSGGTMVPEPPEPGRRGMTTLPFLTGVAMGGDPPYPPPQPALSAPQPQPSQPQAPVSEAPQSEPAPTPRTLAPKTPPMVPRPVAASAAPTELPPPGFHPGAAGGYPKVPSETLPGGAINFGGGPPPTPGPTPRAPVEADAARSPAGPRQTLQMVAEAPAPLPSWLAPGTVTAGELRDASWGARSSPAAASVADPPRTAAMGGPASPPARPAFRQREHTQLSIQPDLMLAASRPLRERAFELLWAAPTLAARLRQAPAFARLLGGGDPHAPATGALAADPSSGPVPYVPAEPSPLADVAAVIARGTPSTANLEHALFEAADGGVLSAPLLLLSGELSLPFDEVEELRTLITSARPAARADAPLAGLLDFAEEMARTDLQASPEVAESLCASVRDAWAQAKHVLPAGHLGQQVERALLFRRAYQRRTLLGKTWIRAHFGHAAGGGDVRPVPAYLPVAAAERLPLFRHFPARLVVEVLSQQDQSEASPVALRIVALAREVARRG